ncbi:MAG: DUF4912 domain-containing protein [Spirochaetales bacterium]|jgi:hypothetical protein|nr:DUF4912 domain-containing protein [Spirochaetales bacterium]
MIRDKLERLSKSELEKLAREKGLKLDPGTKKEYLVDLLQETIEEERSERELDNNSPMRVKACKFRIIEDEVFQTRVEESFPLPGEYNENRIVLLLQDPSWAFAYWDIRPADVEELKTSRPPGQLFLRIYEMAGTPGARSAKASRTSPGVDPRTVQDFYDIPLNYRDSNRYINLPKTGAYYCIELIAFFRAGEKILARSNIILSPHPNLRTEQDNLFFPSHFDDPQSYPRESEIPQRIISDTDALYL